MSLPPKAVPKPAAPAGPVPGPGTGPPPSTQLRAPLATVQLPGPPVAQQPPPVPPTQVFLNALHPRIPRVQPPLDERLFSTQPGVTAVYSVQRPPGPPYTAHDLNKGHPSLAATPPGHASSPGLSQVSVSTVSTAHLYGHPKGWEARGGSPYTAGQNAGTTPLVYSPPTQPMNAQPQSRPFAPGPRPTHHQFFQRTQMQTARPTIPSNNPSIRPPSQAPTATVYPPSQPIMMSMTPMPFPSPQTAQYYIPQYRHSAPPYVGPPQQYSVQPTGPSTFYPGPTPGDFPPAYAAGPPYYPGQTMYTPSPSIIVPTPQQPPPAKREKKTIRIRDPNQGGKDITEEIMSGVGGSRNPTPPAGRPSSTPTPPQFSCPHPHYPHIFYLKSLQLNSQVAEHGHVMYSVDSTPVLPAPVDLKPDDKPKLECIVLKSSSPGLRPGEPPLQRREPSSPAPIAPTPPAPVPAPTPVTAPAPAPAQDLYPSEKSELPLSGPEPASVAPDSSPAPVQSQSPSPALALSPSPAPSPSAPAAPAVEAAEPPVPLVEPGPARVLTPEPEKPEPTRDDSETSASPDQAVKAVNGLAESDSTPPCNDSRPTQLNQTPQLQPAQPSSPRPQLSSSEPSPTTPDLKELKVQVKAAIPVAGEAVTTGAVTPTLTPTTISAAVCTTPAPAPSPSPSLTHPGSQGASETGLARRASNGPEPKESGKEADVSQDEKEEPSLQSNLKLSLCQAASSVPKTWKKPKEDTHVGQAQCPDKEEKLEPAVEATVDTSSPPPVCVERRSSTAAPVEENGEQEAEPLRNGPEHTPEADSSEGVPTPALKEASTNAIQKPELKNGKRQYNRDFLLGFQFMPACVQKPEGLPPISDVVLDKINQNKLPLRQVDPRVISRGPDFTPAFADFGRMIPGSRGAPLLNVGLRRPPPRKIIMNVSVNDEVQLKKAENAWKPGMKRDAAIDDPENLKTQELFRKVRSILNKLTPQMFNQLMKQVTDLTIDTEERLKGVIDLVFEKAIDEPSFSVAYGNMCSCLATLKVPMADKPTSTVNFRKLLLNRCQKEFEKDKMDDDVFEKKQRELEAASSATERERLQEELEEAKDKARRRSIGNIKFIGELFKLRMLTEAIMHDCVVKLLKNHDEESLECLCRLLTTIGKDLDFEKAKPRMDQYFNQMEKIVKERKTSSRIRFMLQDVIDLRLHNWVSRRADQGPKTIEQIHKEAKIEEQEEQRKVHQQLLSKDKRRPVLQREETWNTVPVPKNSRTIDPSKIPKISKPPMDDKIQLGPRAQLNWMKGSSGGAGAKASESDVLRPGASSLNRYSPLQPSPPAAAPASSAASDFDSKRSLSSRGSSGRERNDKPLSSGHPRPGPLSLAGAGKEAPEEPPQEEVHKETQVADTPKLLSSTASRSKLERSQSRESVKLEAASGPATDKPALSEEEMEKRSKSIIDEFLHINDYKEAVQCVEELEQASMLYVFVRVGVESTLERSQITRDHMGQLFHQLLQAGSLSKPQFFKGFSETLELADDMAIDIPHIWLYLAELVNPVLREGGISMRELFSEFSKPLLPVGRAGILFSEILHLLCKQMSHRKVGALWKDSGLSWADFLPETEDVNSFITEQKLDFTLSDCSSPAAAVSNRMLSPEELNKQLEKLLLEDLASDEQIFDWVEANLDESEMSSPPFLRALMTAVCKAAVKLESSSYRVDTAIIQKRLPVLHKYLNSDTERQLQALYALQALIVKLEQPPNLLRMFFDCLYDEDVISEDAFYKWESSKDPAEQQGKGVALKSVTAFFTWLREAEEESEDN
ncbi:eukaryotic translation initiation factor 4 gamma 3 isoform X3 [Astyanax mexicanus]|uniref:eukaryotic translation initiation factor 4 gamma 3 isoform X3 n=1 Tax=Astyanax mexicanus TaxID=7994 RepID=UPI0020CB30F3|nr:eukaryotic translation initiation factor 4 gamma 3 isoform X3 [Astyanax mexicanus]